ncbi:carotenoid oxygenase family protein [Streptomyces mirabilis]|uniref:carotenoid oxygenase family protein n=1 Tax=Streptomyces mirabilis TaxID=68239 RepID=UPI0036CB7A72
MSGADADAFGRLIRNRHHPETGATPTHWFKGSRTVHGIRPREGRNDAQPARIGVMPRGPHGAAKIRWFGYGGCGVVKYDRTSGARRVHRAGDARLRGEAVFVPAVGANREDDGYLLTVVFDLKTGRLPAPGPGRLGPGPDRHRPPPAPGHRRHPRLLDPRYRPRHLRRLTASGPQGIPRGPGPAPPTGPLRQVHSAKPAYTLRNAY